MSSSGAPRGRGGGRNNGGGRRGRPQNGASNGRGGAKGGRGQGRGKNSPAAHKRKNPYNAETQAKINEIQAVTGSYFAVEVIKNHLESNGFDVDATLKALNGMKTNSWSSVVSKDQGKPFARPAGKPAASANPTAVAASASKGPKNGKGPNKGAPANKGGAGKKGGNNGAKPKSAVPAPAVVEELPVDPDAKIVELSKKFNDSLKEIESKSQLLKTMQQEVQAISAQRDAAIAQLSGEKVKLLARRKEIQDELGEISTRLGAIDVEVAQLKEEKIQKVKYLEKKSVELLG